MSQYIANIKGIPHISDLIPVGESRAEIQAIFDDAATHGSGLVNGQGNVTGKTAFLTAKVLNLGSTPLYVGSGCSVKGQGIGASTINYTGAGDPIQFKSYGGHGYHNYGLLEDFSIVSEGNGVGIAAPTYTGTPNATGETSSICLRRIAINCNGTALNFDPSALNYWLETDDVMVMGWQTRVAKLGGTSSAIGFMLHKLKFSNNLRALVLDTASVVSATATTIRFPNTASAVTGAYVGMDVATYNSAGATKDRRLISAYDGPTRTATVSGWVTQPDATYVAKVFKNIGVSNVYIKGDGTITDSEFESQITGATGVSPSLELDSAQVEMSGGHFETHSDQTISRAALKLTNSKLTWPFPQFPQPWSGYMLRTNSRLIVPGYLNPTDNAGTPMTTVANWMQVLDLDGTSMVYIRGIDPFNAARNITALGSASKVVEEFDAAGNSIGYRPIYTSPTFT